jgi:hypothetical protein
MWFYSNYADRDIGMLSLRRYYREVWVVDFEFHAPDGERPRPLCCAACELFSHRAIALWIEDHPPLMPPWSSGKDVLVVAYYASAEMGCYLALKWPFPPRLLDAYAEFKCISSGLDVPSGYGLLGAMTYFGLDGMAAAEKEDMRQLAQRGGPYTSVERDALLAYCQTDVDALGELLPAMLPQIDLARALLRGRYMCAAATIEWNGVPIDTDMLQRLREHWQPIRTHLAQAINRHFPVFVPTGFALPPATSALGAAVRELANTHRLNPLWLLWAIEQVWQEMRELVDESIQARRQARRRSGLTQRVIAHWERAGRDHASWPGLDDLATEIAFTFPSLRLGQVERGGDGPDVAGNLWALLRDHNDRLPPTTHPEILARAVEHVAEDPDGASWSGPLTFSEEYFERYLVSRNIPWPRLESGRLALDEQTFRDMAKVYPATIGPIREVRHALAKLKLERLAVGKDGRNRTLLSAFRSRTGRNQPSANKFVFGPSTWLRCLIKPGPGRAIAYVDWSQQELAIAARLSEDQVMQAAYQSGDFYLHFARMAGAVPPDATKETHMDIREQFKVVSLGVLYGLSEVGLAQRLNIAPCDARRLLRLHREVFQRFWEWSDAVEVQGMLAGALQTVFGWWLHEEHSVILTAQRKPFYNREKHNPSPIAKDFRWAQHRLSRYPRSAQAPSGRDCVTTSTLALTSGWIGCKSSYPIRKLA